MFHQMKELARKFNITVALFYGEAGLGKGLVDAMSSFGCKQPITNAIITKDKCFQNRSEIVSSKTTFKWWPIPGTPVSSHCVK